MNKQRKINGFSLMEILVTIAIIGILATITMIALSGVREKARDTKRKNDLSTIGRFMSMSCYLPASGGGEYDLADLVAELLVTQPQYSQYFKKIPKDPKTGDDVQTNYIYTVSTDGKKCALYANLENLEEKITKQNLTEPTPGGGTGVLESTLTGVNGTNIFYQYSN